MGQIAQAEMELNTVSLAGAPPEVWLERYMASAYGQWQADQPLRYPTWDYDPEQKLKDLGPDVHPIGHMLVTKRLVRAVVYFDEQQWLPEDVAAVERAAITHDIGECTHPSLIKLCGGVVGDIPHGYKTDKQRELEDTVWWKLAQLHYPDVPDSLLARMRALVSHQEDSHTHNGLKAAHDAGFFENGLRAGGVALRETKQGAPPNDRLVKLGSLAVKVTALVEPKLREYAKSFAYADALLENTAGLYKRIQDDLPKITGF